MNSTVPLHIITGFLGVGKTTAILYLLEKLKDKEYSAVVVNERGQVGFDGSLIRSEHKGLEIREVTGGCICCTAGAALEQSLTDILEHATPDRIFLEPSGIAKPGEIIDLINSLPLGKKIEIRPVITMVDPGYFLKPGMMNLPIYRDQVEAAHILLANRSDLADRSTLRDFYQKAKELFPPKGAILTTSFGRIPDHVLAITGVPSRPKGATCDMEDGPGEKYSCVQRPKHSMFHEAGWTWPSATIFDREQLRQSFADLGSGTLGIQGKMERAKGVFHTEKGWYVMELALDQVYEREIQYRGDTIFQIIISGRNQEDSAGIHNVIEACIRNT